MNEKDFGSRVAAALRKARISQCSLAERAGVSQPTISGIVNGQQPRLNVYHKVLHAVEAIEREAAAS